MPPFYEEVTGIPLVDYQSALSYGWLGEATDRPQTEFSDGTVWAAALRVGYSF